MTEGLYQIGAHMQCTHVKMEAKDLGKNNQVLSGEMGGRGYKRQNNIPNVAVFEPHMSTSNTLIPN